MCRARGEQPLIWALSYLLAASSPFHPPATCGVLLRRCGRGPAAPSEPVLLLLRFESLQFAHSASRTKAFLSSCPTFPILLFHVLSWMGRQIKGAVDRRGQIQFISFQCKSQDGRFRLSPEVHPFEEAKPSTRRLLS